MILGQRITALASVGVYVPGGKAAYPSSVLMNIIPAKVAGVKPVSYTHLVNFLDMVENHKMVVENSGLLTVSALKQLDCKGKKIVCILSGGNMDVITTVSYTHLGNVILKFFEGVAKTFLGCIKEGIMKSLRTKIGGDVYKRQGYR